MDSVLLLVCPYWECLKKGIVRRDIGKHKDRHNIADKAVA